MPLEDTTAGNPADAGSALPAETNSPPATTSMEDTIRQAYRAQATKATASELAGAGDGLDGDDAADATASEPAAPRTNSAGRLIDDQGRFLKKDGTVVATEAEADLATPTEPTEAPVVTGQYAEPPKSWKKEAQADWQKLPESLRAEVYRREEDFHKGIQHYKQFSDIGTSLHKVIEPYGQMIVQAGHNAPALIGDLLNMQKVMTTGSKQERAAMAMQILQNTGVSLDELQQVPEQPAIDPNIAALIQKVQSLEGQLTSQSQQREQAEKEDVNTELEKFAADAKNEHFKTVALDMSALLAQGRASNLQEAYDKAVWANPETREKQLQKHKQELARKQADEAAAARKAAGANVVRRGTPPAPNKPGTIEDTIRSEYRRLNGGG
jgi:chemotaxis protein histidine kinase CheA